MSSLPALDTTRIVRELQEQLNTPRVHRMLKTWGHEQLDLVLRVSRRQVVKGPKFTVHPD